MDAAIEVFPQATDHVDPRRLRVPAEDHVVADRAARRGFFGDREVTLSDRVFESMDPFEGKRDPGERHGVLRRVRIPPIVTTRSAPS